MIINLNHLSFKDKLFLVKFLGSSRNNLELQQFFARFNEKAANVMQEGIRLIVIFLSTAQMQEEN